MQNFPTMGFGEMLTLKHVEKNALLCKRKPAKMQQVILSCHSPHGHRQALPSAAAGETFSLSVACIHPLSSVTQLLPLCQGSSVMSSHHSLVKGALVSPSVRISEAQRCQVACQVTQLVKTRAGCHPGVSPSPVFSPPASVPPKVPPTRIKNEIFFLFFFFEAHLELRSN